MAGISFCGGNVFLTVHKWCHQACIPKADFNTDGGKLNCPVHFQVVSQISLVSEAWNLALTIMSPLTFVQCSCPIWSSSPQVVFCSITVTVLCHWESHSLSLQKLSWDFFFHSYLDKQLPNSRTVNKLWNAWIYTLEMFVRGELHVFQSSLHNCVFLFVCAISSWCGRVYWRSRTRITCSLVSGWSLPALLQRSF